MLRLRIGYHRRVGRGLPLYSGRVIALGRLMLATLFMGALLIDVSQPIQAPTQTYELLLAYQLFAAAIAAATWNNWWLDAKLAGPAHAVDIALFTVLVFVTEGYTSPFFVFFVFLLLSAAIRWGWKETSLTAILVAILYLVAGNLAASSDTRFEVYRFIVRAGHLVILSLILVWFGIHQWRARAVSPTEELLAEPLPDRSPIETGLSAAMAALRAQSGAFVWLEEGRETRSVIQHDGALTSAALDAPLQVAGAPFLYDLGHDRTLARDEERNLVDGSPGDRLDAGLAATLRLRKGLAVPIRTGAGEGQMFLEGMPSLSTDHLDFGAQLGVDVATHIQRHALMTAAADSAESRSRIVLARDLHDSVVQFLAGAAFRLEAMRRSEAAGRKVEPELNELKQLMLQEQGELRAFITALRSGTQIPFADLVRDLQALAGRLARQWHIECEVLADPADVMVPTELHLDAHQLVREAVANAVRHAGAKSMRIGLASSRHEVRLDLVNDGKTFPRAGGRFDPPQSLKERVEQAKGAIEVSRGMDVTKVSISLPIAGRAA
ncbi:MAG TPA: histidine kinase [Sphingomicrobium sp.]